MKIGYFLLIFECTKSTSLYAPESPYTHYSLIRNTKAKVSKVSHFEMFDADYTKSNDHSISDADSGQSTNMKIEQLTQYCNMK